MQWCIGGRPLPFENSETFLYLIRYCDDTEKVSKCCMSHNRNESLEHYVDGGGVHEGWSHEGWSP